nr:MAG TPA: hypothetical protein [Caudoviricetes sp.]
MQSNESIKIVSKVLTVPKVPSIMITQGKFTLTQIYHSFFSSSRREAKCE